MCGCRGGRSSVSRTTATKQQIFVQPGSQYDDEDYVMIKYLHPNRGNHHVIGAETKTKYGYRGGGSQFLVNIKDVEAQPHLFEILDSSTKMPESEARQITAPPQRIA